MHTQEEKWLCGAASQRLGAITTTSTLVGNCWPDADEKKLVGALVAISTAVKDAAQLGVPVEVGRRLLECYDELGED